MKEINSNLPSLLLNITDGVIDLGWGHPSAELHPLEDIRIATEKMFARGDAIPLQYGASQGYGPFLDSLARFLSGQSAYPMEVHPNNLFLTAGASQGIDLICTLLTADGDTIIVEDPTYFVIEGIFQSHNLGVVGIPTDDDGMIVDALEEKLLKGLRPKFVYLIPAFQNPTGKTMTIQRRVSLARLAIEYDFYIVADEVYQFLYFKDVPPPPMMHFDHQSKMISVGSFSKILAPGLRVGWIHASENVIQKFSDAALAFSGGGFNHFGAAIIREFIDMGFLVKNLANLRKTYAERASVMTKALEATFGDTIQYEEPTGGYYMWIKVNGTTNTEAVLSKSEGFGVSYRPGNVFSGSRRFGNFLRLSFSLYDSDNLVEGVHRLSKSYGNG